MHKGDAVLNILHHTLLDGTDLVLPTIQMVGQSMNLPWMDQPIAEMIHFFTQCH